MLPSLEKRYCDRAELVHKQRLARRTLRVGLYFHCLSFFLDPFVAEPSSRLPLAIGHALMIAYFLVFELLERRKRTPDPSRFAYCAIFFHFAIYAYTSYVAMHSFGALLPKSCAVMLVFAMISQLVTPFGLRGTLATAAYSIALCVVVTRGHEHAVAYWAMFCSGVVCVSAIRELRIRLVREAASAELRNKLLMAPAHVVARLVESESDASVEAAFRPAMRRSASVCIGWRNYEELAFAIPGRKLAAILSAYYACCDEAVGAVSGVAHYADAIVDELFVVFFDDETQSEERALRAAYEFAQGVLQRVRAEPKLAAVAAEIDIGIASGEILLGLMGPQEHRKTTGIGETPGRAARLKAAAGRLRGPLGPASRICLDAGAATHVAANIGAPLRSYALGQSEEFRDLGTNTVFFWTAA